MSTSPELSRLSVNIGLAELGRVVERRDFLWPELCHLLTTQTESADKSGPGWVPSDIPPGPRKGEFVRYWNVLALDIEAKAVNEPTADGKERKRLTGAKAPPLDLVAIELGLVRWAACMATTWSHEAPIPDGGTLGPRYRLVLPLSRPLEVSMVKPVALYVATMLGLAEVLDHSTFKGPDIFFLPRYPTERQSQREVRTVDGYPLDVERLLHQIESTTRAPSPTTGTKSNGLIKVFNDRFNCTEILEHHGYVAHGKDRWIWPGSTTGTAGVVRMPESGRIFSHHENDPLRSQHGHDAFSLYCVLEHQNNISGALRAAADVLSMPSGTAGVALQAPAGEVLQDDRGRFCEVNVADVLTNPEPPHRFFWGKYLPAEAVTLLSAHGGTGKSGFGLQLAAHIAMGLDFLGHPVIQGKALFLSAEDRTSVLRSRLAAICLNHSIDPVVLAEHLYLLDATDAAVLWDVEGRDKKCGPTAHYHELQQFITDREIAFVVIDNSSDTFGADRIDKSSVTRFVRALSRLVHKQHGATLLLSHVNRATAANSRTATENYSDSVSWHNAARSRLYMKASDDGSVRTLAHEKTNYGTLGPTLTLQAMKTCGLELADASGAGDLEQKTLQIELLDIMDKKIIIKLIQEFYDRGDWISPSQSSPGGNAYSMLSGEAGFPSTLIKKKALTLCRALERDGYLAREEYRKVTQRKQGERWVVTQEGRDWAGLVAKNAPTAPTAPTGENSEVDAVSAGNGEARADPVRQHVGGTRGAARRAQSAQTKKIATKRKPKSGTPSIKAVPEVGAVTKAKRGKKKCAPVQ